MHEERKWCVYIHTSPSNKRYIGITSRKPEERWGNGNGYKHNLHFTNAIAKYGWNNFKHEVVMKELSEQDAKSAEIELISKYNTTNPLYGYNISSGGGGTFGVRHFGKDNHFYGKHHTDEAKQKMRQNQRDKHGNNNPFYNKHHSSETLQYLSDIGKRRDMSYLQTPWTDARRSQTSKRHGKIIQKFDLNMCLIKEYPSLSVLENMGYRRASIRDVCCGRKESYKGFIWKYKNQEDSGSCVVPGTRREDIYCVDADMNLLNVYKSYIKAGHATGINRKQIAKSCNTERHFYGQYNWFFKSDYENLKKEA